VPTVALGELRTGFARIGRVGLIVVDA